MLVDVTASNITRRASIFEYFTRWAERRAASLTISYSAAIATRRYGIFWDFCLFCAKIVIEITENAGKTRDKCSSIDWTYQRSFLPVSRR